MTESATIAPPRPSPARRKAPATWEPASETALHKSIEGDNYSAAQSRRDRVAARRRKSPEAYLSSSDSERLRQKVRRVTCSEWWERFVSSQAEAQGVQHNVDLDETIERLAKFGIYPPPSDHAPMLPCRCQSCGGMRRWPRYYIRTDGSGLSEECWRELQSHKPEIEDE